MKHCISTAVLLFALACALAQTARGDEARGASRIGILNSQGAPQAWEEALRKRFIADGYAVGTRLVIDSRPLARSQEEMTRQARELEQSGVAVIVAIGSPATRVALAATKRPVVFVAGNPVASGFAESLGRPGGRATGISVLSTELNQKRLELLRKFSPSVRRVLYLRNAANPTSAFDLEEVKTAARSLGLQLHPLDVNGIEGLDAALRGIQRKAGDGLVVTADLYFLANKAEIARAVRQAGIPAVLPYREYHEAGVLMTYSPDYEVELARVASFVERILRGAAPGDLAVEQISRYELSIDLRVARQMGVTVPQELLLRADKIIE